MRLPRSFAVFIAGCFPVVVAACVADEPTSSAPDSDAGSGTDAGIPQESSVFEAGGGDATTGTPRMTAVGMGSFSACAIGTDGSVWCWGANTFGALGVTPLGPVRPQAKPVPGIPSMLAVSVGSTHVCAVSSTNDVWCWGSNFSGELGHDPATDSSCGANFPCSGTPAQVLGIKAVQVAALSETTCALTTTGDVTCWGRGDSGLLGLGAPGDAGALPQPTTKGFMPVPIQGFPAGGVATLGGSSWPGTTACAILTSNGEVRCWGNDTVQGLGHPAGPGDVAVPGGNCANGCNATPESVVFADGGVLQNMFSVAGSFTNCAFGSAAGQLYCWGSNGCGQLSNGGVGSDGGALSSSSSPAVALGSPVAEVSGADAMCAVLQSHEVVCWGDDTKGIVGASTPSACAYTNEGSAGIGTSVVRAQPASLRAVSVSVGQFAAAAVDEDGHVQAWGQNGLTGVLGHQPGSGHDDSTANNRDPVPDYVDGLGP